MPEINSAQRYEDLTDAIDFIGEHREKYFSRRVDHLPWWFLKRVQQYLEVQRSVAFNTVFDPPKEPKPWWAFWRSNG